MPNRTFLTTLPMLLSALCASCTPHLTREQCLNMNWNSVGYDDGAHGHFQRNLSNDIADCAKFKININTHAYQKGWRSGVLFFCKASHGYVLGTQGQTYNHICPTDLAGAFEQSWRRGIRKFCVPDSAYNLGRSGKAFPNFCPATLAIAFRNAYDDGRRLYDAIQDVQNQLNDVNQRLSNAHADIRHRQHEINRRLRNMNRPGSIPQSRRMARQANQRDRFAIDDLNHRIRDWEKQRNRLQLQVNRIQSK